MKKLIISHGEKGGVGKSMIASVIANHLVHHHEKDSLLLIEGDTGIPDIAARYKDKLRTIGLPLQRSDLAVEAIGELFSTLEQEFNADTETVLINLPAGAAQTVDKHAAELIAPVLEMLDVQLVVTYAIGTGVESAQAAGKSLEAGLAGIADRRVAVPNSALGEPSKMAWTRSNEREAWLESGGTEFVLPTLTPRLADRLHELDGSLTEIAGGETANLTLVDRMVMTKFIRDCQQLVDEVSSNE